MKNHILKNDGENVSKNEWSSEQHTLNYLKKANEIPHRSDGENVLFYLILDDVKRVLDLGTCDGRLIRLLKNQ
jgi:tRNA (cmo5U34)-methyltransferase